VNENLLINNNIKLEFGLWVSVMVSDVVSQFGGNIQGNLQDYEMSYTGTK